MCRLGDCSLWLGCGVIFDGKIGEGRIWLGMVL